MKSRYPMDMQKSSVQNLVHMAPANNTDRRQESMSSTPSDHTGIPTVGWVSLVASLICVLFAGVYYAMMVEALLHDRRHKLAEDGMEFGILSLVVFGPVTLVALIAAGFARGRRGLCFTAALAFPAFFVLYILFVEYVF